ncbi:hypothetical protein BO70DRAFT_424981 [Aspergillus heteromorphus CBS 117.55]|uniref:MINDY deubiquitinase domain-containing protein n=1 Tax=Aspergillus heteromorphus CBS 117.55 TaxID=1448321 RepID=A0A317X0S6_9EURO|nr:uncharacterized protein BO70DRAFT_424981 [Aspergillus heteromorphus CBS 117.55]PWY92254.1 hypothetical protein BO70DRAFT_424981 [Aspergillus heteromorphus CBS 117.55]
MVLRKRAPPRLHSLTLGNDRSGTRDPLSKTSPTSKSLSSSSPKRLTRPRRAQSSPHPHRVASEESIFSPDLNTSPAFDLMPLEQAQRSPIRSSAGDGSNPWADELTERFGLGPPDAVGSHQPAPENPAQTDMAGDRRAEQVPAIAIPRAQDRPAAQEWQPDRREGHADWEYLGQSPVQLQSNNPFLKPRTPDPNPWQERNSRLSYGETSSQSHDGASMHLGQDEGYIPMTARLSLFDQPEAESPWVGENSTSAPPTASLPAYAYHGADQPYSDPSANYQGPANPSAASYDTHLQPTQPLHAEGRHSPAKSTSTPGTISTNTTGSSHVLIELDEARNPYAEDVPKKTSPNYDSVALPPLPQQERPGPPLPERPDCAEPSPGHPRSAWSAPISEAEAKRQQEQRSETYSIRHVNWTDGTGNLRESPMLVQNKNGPCPLLALVNALVLRAASHDSQPPVVRALQTKEQISLGLLIEALFDELTTRLGPNDEFPDIEALSRFLTMLHTGMNVNPRLTLASNDSVGTFLETEDIRLYGTFGVPLLHGWVAEPSTEANAAMVRVAQYHEDIQLLPFRRQDLEDRVFRGNSLTPEEERVMADIHTIEQFTDIENATQLSTFGLRHLLTKLQPGSFSILFRNDHFSTLYKHPQLNQLFTLVTDAGYSTHAEVVWENLVDVTGSDAGFFAGDFRPVSHNTSQQSDPSGPRSSSHTGRTSSAPPEPQRNSTMTPQEQADADYAYALSLQYQEEEQRARAENNPTRNSRSSLPYPPSEMPPSRTHPHNRSSSAVNNTNGNGSYAAVAGNRSSRQSQRPARYSQSHLDTHTARRTADDDDVPPPSYEQAARTPVYPSPSPQRNPNTTFSDSPSGSPYQRAQLGRRPPGPPPIATVPGERVRDRNKDCVVM